MCNVCKYGRFKCFTITYNDVNKVRIINLGNNSLMIWEVLLLKETIQETKKNKFLKKAVRFLKN